MPPAGWGRIMPISSSADPFAGFAGARVLVTGGTSGIGQSIGRAFAAHGAVVTVTGASQAEVDGCQLAPNMSAIALNVQDRAVVAGYFTGLSALDHLINCAGIIRRGAETDPDVFDQVIDINLGGTMRCCTLARPLLVASKGTIINLASMLSFFGGGLVPAYTASKGGIAQLTKSLAIAYAPDGIRVNAIAPGWIASDMLDRALRGDSARQAKILGRTPMARFGEPDDIGWAAVYLCSPAAKFVTGVVLPVDGGAAEAF